MSAPFQMVMLFALLASTVLAQGALSGIPSPAHQSRSFHHSGVENENCIAPAAPVEFEAFTVLKLRGQPGLITQKDLTKLQDTLVVSYNSVIMCNQPGAFKVVDEAEILPNAALAENFLSSPPAGVYFTYVVVSVNVWYFAALSSRVQALISYSFRVGDSRTL